MKKQKTEGKTTGIRLRDSVLKEVQDLAIIENRNFSNMVETILMRYFEKNQPK